MLTVWLYMEIERREDVQYFILITASNILSSTPVTIRQVTQAAVAESQVFILSPLAFPFWKTEQCVLHSMSCTFSASSLPSRTGAGFYLLASVEGGFNCRSNQILHTNWRELPFCPFLKRQHVFRSPQTRCSHRVNYTGKQVFCLCLDLAYEFGAGTSVAIFMNLSGTTLNRTGLKIKTPLVY